MWTTCFVLARRRLPSAPSSRRSIIGLRRKSPCSGVLVVDWPRREDRSLRIKNIWPNVASQIRAAFASIVLKTGLQIAARTGDDLQHLRGCRLLFQRFGKIVGALPELVEQPRVLDGDDSLRGESSEPARSACR